MKKLIRNIAALSVLTTAGIHVANCFIEETSTHKNILSKRNGHYFHWKYGDIFYTKEGKGSPLLLVHNLAPDCSGYEWVKVIKQLSKTHTVYTIDLLGCGRSEKPASTYTNFLYVQLLNDFIRYVIKNKTDVVASGQSSTFVLMSNLMESDNIGKIVLIHPCPTDEKTDMKKNVNSMIPKIIMELPVLGTYIYNVLMRKAYIRDHYANDYCSKSYYITPDMIDAYYEAAHLNRSRGRYLFASIYNNYTNVNITKALQKISNEIFIIENQEEEKTISQYQSYNDSITGVVVNNTQCLPHMEAPRKTCDYITQFLDQ